jgi:hypothetical protein
MPFSLTKIIVFHEFRSVFLFLIVVVIAAGIVDWVWEKQNKTPTHAAASVIYAFSLKKNVTEVFKIPRKAAPGQVTCLHGIRALSIAWVFLGHRYEIFYYAMPFMNSFFAAEVALILFSHHECVV